MDQDVNNNNKTLLLVYLLKLTQTDNAHAHTVKQLSHTEPVASNSRLSHAYQDRPTTAELALAQPATLSSPSELAANKTPPHRAATHSLR